MDIAASLWPCAVQVQVGDWIYEIPDLPAADWIRAIADPDGGSIVPGLLEPEDQQLIWRGFARGELDTVDLNNAWRDAVGAATGRPWWQATRLVLSATARDNWPVVHGRLVQRGVDLERYSIGGFCNVVHTMALEACKDANERSQYEFDLTAAPPGVEPEEALRATDSAGDFMAAMQQLQAFGGGSG